MLTSTINDRLGVLGLLSHPDLALESEHDASGNYGILDRSLRSNGCTTTSPPSEATPVTSRPPARAVAEDAGRRFSEQLGGTTVAEMRTMCVERILAAADSLGDHWRPAVDGHVLDRSPAEIYATGQQVDVRILVGSTADEASLAPADPPDTDVDEYRSSAHETHDDDADRFLELYPGTPTDHVLESRLQAETDEIMTNAAGLPAWTTFEQAPDDVIEFSDGGGGMTDRAPTPSTSGWATTGRSHDKQHR